jgi:hypothetical protein
MAYLRFGRESNWYVFWTSTPGAESSRKEAQTLAIWHADHRALGFVRSYDEVRTMLETGDFSSIPGFTPADTEVIRSALREFIADVENDEASSG